MFSQSCQSILQSRLVTCCSKHYGEHCYIGGKYNAYNTCYSNDNAMLSVYIALLTDDIE